MKQLNKLILAGLVIVFANVTWAATEVKIGIVDLPQAIQATADGKKIKKQLEEEYNKKKAELEGRAKDISKMQADFDKKSLVLTDEARLKKQEEINVEKTKFMEMREKNLQDLAKKDRELSQPMIKKLNEVIGKIAKEQGYTVILHKNDQNLVWASKEVDITDQVIKALEKK